MFDTRGVYRRAGSSRTTSSRSEVAPGARPRRHTVHTPLDARIHHRQIRALRGRGLEVTYAAPWSGYGVDPADAVAGVRTLDLPRAVGPATARAPCARAPPRHARSRGRAHDLVLLHDPELVLAVAAGCDAAAAGGARRARGHGRVAGRPPVGPGPLRPVAAGRRGRSSGGPSGACTCCSPRRATRPGSAAPHPFVPNVPPPPPSEPPPPGRPTASCTWDGSPSAAALASCSRSRRGCHGRVRVRADRSRRRRRPRRPRSGRRRGAPRVGRVRPERRRPAPRRGGHRGAVAGPRAAEPRRFAADQGARVPRRDVCRSCRPTCAVTGAFLREHDVGIAVPVTAPGRDPTSTAWSPPSIAWPTDGPGRVAMADRGYARRARRTQLGRRGRGVRDDPRGDGRSASRRRRGVNGPPRSAAPVLPPLAADAEVSVVVPARDAAATIGAAIRSALDQGPIVTEVAVATSPDDTSTRAAATAAAAGDPRVRVVDVPGGRTPDALNAGDRRDVRRGGRPRRRARRAARRATSPGRSRRCGAPVRRNVGGRQVPTAAGGFAAAVGRRHGVARRRRRCGLPHRRPRRSGRHGLPRRLPTRRAGRGRRLRRAAHPQPGRRTQPAAARVPATSSGSTRELAVAYRPAIDRPRARLPVPPVRPVAPGDRAPSTAGRSGPGSWPRRRWSSVSSGGVAAAAATASAGGRRRPGRRLRGGAGRRGRQRRADPDPDPATAARARDDAPGVGVRLPGRAAARSAAAPTLSGRRRDRPSYLGPAARPPVGAERRSGRPPPRRRRRLGAADRPRVRARRRRRDHRGPAAADPAEPPRVPPGDAAGCAVAVHHRGRDDARACRRGPRADGLFDWRDLPGPGSTCCRSPRSRCCSSRRLYFGGLYEREPRLGAPSALPRAARQTLGGGRHVRAAHPRPDPARQRARVHDAAGAADPDPEPRRPDRPRGRSRSP